MRKIRAIKRTITGIAVDAAYSQAGTGFARKLMASPVNAPARRFIKAKGLEGSIRRLASENLPQGTYFAKLTIAKWQVHKGRGFRLLQDGELVYGNKIEPPARGFPLEYRNIIVTSRDPKRFSLDIDAPYELKIGRGAFTTPQQLKYDHQYGVEQHGDTYYSLRGNTTNPKKLFITFPGFGPSTSRISYAVSYLKAITNADLKDTLMVCFQDRYLAAGSYMMVDNAGRPLYGRVWQAIEDLRTRFGIDPAQMLFFGASKGGSIAIHYAKDFPAAQLLLAVPQMNLPYYFNKPFFRDNLFRNRALHDVQQPEDSLREYFAEGRRIDYFYTNSDELSNHSLIELVRDVPNLTKYRVDGVHSDVARAALPAMLGIIRGFLSGPQHREMGVDEVRSFPQENGIQVQIRVDSVGSKIARANWFIEGWLGQTRFLQSMSEHSYDFLKFTSEKQQLYPAYDPIQHLSAVVAIEANGTQWTGTLPGSLMQDSNQDVQHSMSASALSLHAKHPETYVVLDGDHFARFRYRSYGADIEGDTMEVHFVGDAEIDVSSESLDRGEHKASHVAVVEPLDGWAMADLLALRFVIAAKAERLLTVVHAAGSADKAVDTFGAVDWKASSVIAIVDEASSSHEVPVNVG
ncbi:hypothetical protein [Arthrobacter sp. StoSoilB13]|uniref:hypothetical protein n=1 Tax=Arthrobacter sp. StoSoilB13 TaxID=2830993 RepID=UPI001CC618E4|nr:hypothetical protein [Arthrobacter sp. StoSoilB13]BCW49572.1 hypothetical protein StoSoilB13_19140 [Arthrobacter sp. StoSoilB13]